MTSVYRHAGRMAFLAGAAWVAGCSPQGPDEEREQHASVPTPTPAPTAPTPSPATLPLAAGVYVLQGESCAHPANAGWRVWNGAGLSGSATRACRTTVVDAEGDRFRLSNSCENTYDQSRSATDHVLDIGEGDRFTLDGQSFHRCPDGEAPEYLEAIAKGK